jgi:hypothetical protein
MHVTGHLDLATRTAARDKRSVGPIIGMDDIPPLATSALAQAEGPTEWAWLVLTRHRLGGSISPRVQERYPDSTRRG